MHRGICDPRPIILCHDNTIIKEYISKSLKKNPHLQKSDIIYAWKRSHIESIRLFNFYPLTNIVLSLEEHAEYP